MRQILISFIFLIFIGLGNTANAQSNINALNDIEKKINNMSYDDGTIFLFAIKVDNSGDIEEYFTGQLNYLSDKERVGYITSSKLYRCKVLTKRNSSPFKKKIKGKVTADCTNNNKFKGKWSSIGVAAGSGYAKDLNGSKIEPL